MGSRLLKGVSLSRRVPVGKTTFTVDWFIGAPQIFYRRTPEVNIAQINLQSLKDA